MNNNIYSFYYYLLFINKYSFYYLYIYYFLFINKYSFYYLLLFYYLLNTLFII